MKEFHIYHMARNCAKHNFELDDHWYGTPYQKDYLDWALANPELYLQRVSGELYRIEAVIDDIAYLMREKGVSFEEPKLVSPSLEEANSHVFHRFTIRQFEYAEKLSNQLSYRTPEEIDVIESKVLRQMNVLLAAREDLVVTKVRFEHYLAAK